MDRATRCVATVEGGAARCIALPATRRDFYDIEADVDVDLDIAAEIGAASTAVVQWDGRSVLGASGVDLDDAAGGRWRTA